MVNAKPEMTLSEARMVLGVRRTASDDELRQAFRAAAKAAHPDRDGGAAERFRQVVAAYQVLQETAPPRRKPPPAARAPGPTLAIPPLVAWAGGAVIYQAPDGRLLRLRLPPGLRQGDSVRAGGEALTVSIQAHPEVRVRGHDLWLTVEVPLRTLKEGGRVAVATPIGRRILWVTKKAGERRLVRAPDLGLPARGRHPQGALFVRLAPKTGALDSAARVLLRRFTAAWAA